jgi:hypothetical protein
VHEPGESLESLLEPPENAIVALQSRDEPRMPGVITRLERRQAEIVAALASKERQEQDHRRGGEGWSSPRPETATWGDAPRRPDDRNPCGVHKLVRRPDLPVCSEIVFPHPTGNQRQID